MAGVGLGMAVRSRGLQGTGAVPAGRTASFHPGTEPAALRGILQP